MTHLQKQLKKICSLCEERQALAEKDRQLFNREFNSGMGNGGERERGRDITGSQPDTCTCSSALSLSTPTTF